MSEKNTLIKIEGKIKISVAFFEAEKLVFNFFLKK
jgi:hypothetical protein